MVNSKRALKGGRWVSRSHKINDMQVQRYLKSSFRLGLRVRVYTIQRFDSSALMNNLC
jgi:hypothetical protein